jgi:hypothetical protein
MVVFLYNTRPLYLGVMLSVPPVSASPAAAGVFSLSILFLLSLTGQAWRIQVETPMRGKSQPWTKNQTATKPMKSHISLIFISFHDFDGDVSPVFAVSAQGVSLRTVSASSKTV